MPYYDVFPTQVPLPLPCVKVASIAKRTAAILADGSLWTWGDNTIDGTNFGRVGSIVILAGITWVRVFVLCGLEPSEPDVDEDADGIDDSWESWMGMNSTDPNDAFLDSDGDGLTNLEEMAMRLDPQNASTHGIPDSDFAANGGQLSPPEDYVEVPFSVGDASGSHSERWELSVQSRDPSEIGECLDDGLHFNSVGYSNMATCFFHAIQSGLQQDVP